LSKLFPDLVPPHGFPVTDRSEESALTLLQESGLDLKTPLRELALRHGLVRGRGVEEEVPLPAVTTLSSVPLSFHAPYNPESAELPCRFAQAAYIVHDDAERNHAQIADELRARLGPGSKSGPQNIEEEWIFGRIALRVSPWVSESPEPPQRIASSLTDPRLRVAAKVVFTAT
jgi:hypothetical protein